MATVKLATLLVRTLAKPIANKIKNQAAQHETFRNLCIDFAQMTHRSEVKLRTYILGEPAKHIRPLSEVRAVENGANMLAEGFLFTVAAALIIGETWRSARSESKRRTSVHDQLDDLGTRLGELATRVDGLSSLVESQTRGEGQRNGQPPPETIRPFLLPPPQETTADTRVSHNAAVSNTQPVAVDTHSSPRA